MDKKDINFLEELLYDKDHTTSQLDDINNPLILHFFAANYNWNSGFDVPKSLNENCNLGTGLLMFHYADGYRMLLNPEEFSNSTLEEMYDLMFFIELIEK